MTSNSAYKELLAHLNKIEALSQVSGLLSWDQETMMPSTGAEARAEQMGAMSSILHGLQTDPRMGDWLSAIDAENLDRVAQANVREARRKYDRAVKIPGDLSEELARVTALAHGKWALARKNNDFAAFAPTLETIIKLKRVEASCLTADGDELYDALLEDFEPGMKSADLALLLGKLRPQLANLREAIEGSSIKPKNITGSFDQASQMEMTNRLATVFNYDLNGGRIDLAVHPFSSGYRSDSRITTRVNPDNPFDCLYSTIHEVGHSNYEQGRDPAMDRTPAGSYASMAVHESQSRMLENQIGRSRPFMEWLYPQMVEVFGEMNISSPQELFATINRVENGFIRTEADEVHYNLHVLLRFDLERALIRDELQVSELEAAWNDRFLADFGRQVDKPANGVLQDVHWSGGLFGYFPTYSLGNIYAAELFSAIGKAIPNRDELISKGELSPISDWLQKNIHVQGNVFPAPELIERAIGKSADEQALTSYLEEKFSGLYQL